MLPLLTGPILQLSVASIQYCLLLVLGSRGFVRAVALLVVLTALRDIHVLGRRGLLLSMKHLGCLGLVLL
jgi:hypothetical protein